MHVSANGLGISLGFTGFLNYHIPALGNIRFSTSEDMAAKMTASRLVYANWDLCSIW